MSKSTAKNLSVLFHLNVRSELDNKISPRSCLWVNLMRFLVFPGAIYQDNVARKDLPPMRRTTHLVVMVAEGDKYVGCKKWNIPTVTAE